MNELLDKILIDSTLFENVKLESYDNLLLALKLADENITNRLLKTKGIWTKAKLNEIKKLIQDEILKAYGGVFATVQDEAVEAANISYALLGSTIGATIPTGVANELINSRRLIQMSENKAYEFKQLFDLASDNHERQLRTVVASGVVQGRPIDAMIRDYQIKSGNLAKANIRTNINTVIGQSRATAKFAQFKRLEDLGVVKGYIYSSVFDGRTSDYCIRMSGKKFYKPIEEISHLVKTHANCRSELVGLTDNEVQNRRASEFGETDAEDYPTWFETTPEYFKRAKLTKKQYEGYKKGIYKVGSLNDVTKQMTLKQIRELSDRIIKNN